ncbi:Polysaccharide biosynthesis protein [Lacunisphaera limnophila]|uniref:Polysaccharide biosynthesis protein n=1 Tax=Lacunisphaera limnophila TaxID=1838286 RepID=A0A1D8AVR7_9BACT|nr:oligosaccharide flippase family protein [Lacunisphaera limnophila]AOS44989.1 Polysaccharide biosynthesis protein [Lacunisphaera limnophila]
MIAGSGLLKLLSSAGLYGIANLVGALTPLIVLPVLSRSLSAGDLGRFALYQSALALALPGISMGVHGAVSRQYLNRDTIDFARYVSSLLAISLAAGTGTLVVLWMIGLFAPGVLGGNGVVFQYAVVSAIGLSLLQVFLAIVQMRQKHLLYAAIQCLVTGLLIAASMGAVAVRPDWQSVLRANMAAYGAIGLVVAGILFTQKLAAWRISKEYAVHALRFGAPLVPHLLAASVITMLDRFFIAHFHGVEAVAAYAVAYQVAVALNLACSSFGNAWAPWLMHQLHVRSAGTGARITRYLLVYFAGVVALGGVLWAVSPWIIALVGGDRYSAAYHWMPWLIAGFVFNGVSRALGVIPFYHGRTLALALATVGGAGTSVGLNVVLVPSLGAAGAAVAQCLGFLVTAVLTARLAVSLESLPWVAVIKSTFTRP